MKQDAYKFSWKKGLRTDDSLNVNESTRIKSENFQLTMKPESQNSKTLKVSIAEVQNRFKDFGRRLLVAVYHKHRKFLANRNTPNNPKRSEEQVEKEYPLDKLKSWHEKFDLREHVYELAALDLELPEKPGISSPGTPKGSAGRHFLQMFTDQKASFQQTPPATPKKNAEETNTTPNYMNTPEYKRLPPGLKKKYEEKRLKEQEKAMLKQDREAHAKVNDLKQLFDVARAIKSYFNIKRVSSAPVDSLAKKVSKSADTLSSEHDATLKITELCKIDGVDETLELLDLDGRAYVRMKPNTTLKMINDCIEMKMQRERGHLVA